jgi:hypothetical protein
MAWAMVIATRAAAETSARFSPTAPELFQSYWYHVFSRLAQAVANDPEIPSYVSMPPPLEIPVNFNDVGAGKGKKCPPDCPSSPVSYFKCKSVIGRLYQIFAVPC